MRRLSRISTILALHAAIFAVRKGRRLRRFSQRQKPLMAASLTAFVVLGTGAAVSQIPSYQEPVQVRLPTVDGASGAVVVPVKRLRPYIQGSVGGVFPRSVEVDTETSPVFRDVELDYGAAVIGGIEIGARNIGGTGLRMGASAQYTSLDLSKASVVVNGSSVSINRNNIKNLVGAELDVDAGLVMFNTYYDFEINKSKFVPYIGIGAGVAFIQDVSERPFTYSLMAGVDYRATDNLSLGMKYTYNRIMSFLDVVDIKYKGVSSNMIVGTLTYTF